MQQDSLIDAIKSEDSDKVRDELLKVAKINALHPRGTILYRAVKLTHNLDVIRAIVDKGADCNIVQFDFDRNEEHRNEFELEHCCFISTPLDYLYHHNSQGEYDELIKHLLKTRPMVSEDIVKQRIFFCQQLFDDKTHEKLFDYAASYLLRENMYDLLPSLDSKSGRAIVGATMNANVSFKGKSLDEGGTHKASFMVVVRGLLEQLVRFKLCNGSLIKTPEQYSAILRELVHNLETYYLLKHVRLASMEPRKEIRESFYSSIIRNIIEQLQKKMEIKEELTMPVHWEGHALCVNLVRKSDTIAIRIDNLNAGEQKKHPTTTFENEKDILILVPKIIGEIQLGKLGYNEEYFKLLLECMAVTADRESRIKILYHYDKIKFLIKENNSEMTNELVEQSRKLQCFIQQAESNCFYKSHEPGFAIRSNDTTIYQIIITSVRKCATALARDDLPEIRNELEKSFRYYWNQELNTRFKMIRNEYLNYKIARIKKTSKQYDIEKSYINLTIMEAKDQKEKEKKLRDATHNEEQIHGYEDLYNTKTLVKVEKILDFCTNDTKRICIFGRAGIGKTTFCQYVAYQWAKRQMWEEYQLVILIPLRQLTEERYPYSSDKSYSPIDLIRKEYNFGIELSKEDEKFFDEQYTHHQVLWLLDGYDEFKENIPQYLKDLIQLLIKEQSHILTSRPYCCPLSYDVQMEIIGYTDDDIPKYVDQFFKEIETTSNNTFLDGPSLLSFLQSNPKIWGVAHIPVNLELICSLWGDTKWKETKTLTITKLYDDMVEWLCRRYLIKRGITTNIVNKKTKKEVYKDCQRELMFLETLAFNAIKDGIIIIPSKVLNNVLDEVDYSSESDSDLLNFGILKSFDDKRTGSQVEVDKDYYFLHLSFQEHFAARYLFNALNNEENEKKKEKEKVINFIKNNKYDQCFELVLPFVFGLLIEKKNEDLIDTFWKAILEEPLDLIGFKHVQLVMSCIEEASEKSNFSRRNELIDLITEWIKREMTVVNTYYFIHGQFQHALQRSPSLLSEPKVIDTLQKLFEKQDIEGKANIFYLISKTPTFNPSAELIDFLLMGLENDDRRVQPYPIEALEKMGEKAANNRVIDKLMSLRNNESEYTRKDMWEVLGKIIEKASKDTVINMPTIADSDNEHNVRKSAYQALEKICKKDTRNDVVMALVEAIEKDDRNVKECACRILGSLAKIDEKTIEEEMISNLKTLVKKKKQLFANFACEVVKELEKKTIEGAVIDTVESLFEDEDESIRSSACETLGRMGEKAARDNIIKKLLAAVEDRSCVVRENACETLGKIGKTAARDDVIDKLLRVVKDEEARVRMRACEALGNMGEKAAKTGVIDKLLTAVNDKEALVRETACEALGKISKKTTRDDVIDKLLTVVKGEEGRVRNIACEALKNMGEKAAKDDVIKVLIAVVSDKDSGTSIRISKVLGNMGERAIRNDVIEKLVAAVGSNSDRVSESAYTALENLGKFNKRVVRHKMIETLKNSLNDENEDVRDNACRTLDKMSQKDVGDDVIEMLSIAVEDQSYTVKERACKTLGRMGEKAPRDDIIKKLLAAVEDRSCVVRENACQTLGKIGKTTARNDVIDKLLTAVDDEKAQVRMRACEALGNMGEKAAKKDVFDKLLTAINDKEARVRMRACEALGNMGKEAAKEGVIDKLLTAVDDEKAQVRMRACEALGNMGEKAAKDYVIERLRITLMNENRWVLPDTSKELIAAVEDENLFIMRRDFESLLMMDERREDDASIEMKLTNIIDEAYNVSRSSYTALRSPNKINESVVRDRMIEKLKILCSGKDAYLITNPHRIFYKMRTEYTYDYLRLSDILRLAFEHESWMVKVCACEALGKMGEKAAKDDVIETLWITIQDDNSEMVTEHALKVLENLGKSSNEVVRNKVIEKLMIVVDNEKENVRRYAYKLLEELGERAATNAMIEKLINNINNDSYADREEACAALKRMGKNAARDDVIRVLATVVRDQSSGAYGAYEALEKLTEIVCSNGVAKHEKITFLCKLMKYLYKDTDFNFYTNRYCLYLLKTLPISHLNDVPVGIESKVWLPIFAFAILVQGHAVTLVDNSLVVFSSEGRIELNVKSSEMREYLIKLFADLEKNFFSLSR